MRLDIGPRLILLSCGGVLLVGLFLGGYFVRHESRALSDELDVRARMLANHLALSCEFPLLTQNQEALANILRGTLNQKDVIYCLIEDNSGWIRVETGAKAGKHREYAAPILTRKPMEPGSEELILGAGAGAEMENIGEVRVAVSLQDLHRRTIDVLWTAGIFVLAAILLGALIIAWVVQGAMVRPIRKLVRATERLARGDLDARVDVPGDDTVGRLAAAFNKMTGDLRSVTVSKDYVDNILGSMGDALIVTGPDGTIRTVNDYAVRLLGFSKDELIGKPLGLFWKDAGKSSPPADNVETLFSTRGGETVTVSVAATPMAVGSSSPSGMVYVARDLTERKKIEALILRSEKLSAVGQLAAGVAHEINNPLGVILGFAQGMAERLQPHHPWELPVKSIEREALRCKNLVQDLLTFSRASQTDREAIHLNQAVDGALSLVQAQARMSKVQLVKKLAEDLPLLLGNRTQIQQVIINLANNSLDAMPDGGTLTVETSFLEDQPQSWVRLKIADTGGGIPEEVLPRIFEPFFTTKPVGQGTGLGLGLVHEIVSKHSGIIEVQSRPGCTEFTVKWPARTPQEISERKNFFQEEKAAPMPLPPGARRV